MRSCSWSPSCRQPASGEWCDEHGTIMVPLFRPIARSGSRRPRAVHDALLRRLDDERAEIVARYVAKAERPIRLDGHSDALQRAVSVASDAGWITPARDGFVPGPVEIGERPVLDLEPVAEDATESPAEARRIEMVRRYIERSDRPPMRSEISRALNFTAGIANGVLSAGRARGVFHVPHTGSRAYYLGACPPPRDLGGELTEYVRQTGGTNATEAAEALDMVPAEVTRAIKLAVAAGTITTKRGHGKTILPAA